ncbi:MAG: peptidoglycan recognition family protein [Candidatus Paceibacterota bacterium]
MFTFNISEWKIKIKNPHWYKEIPQVLKDLSRLHDMDRPAYEKQKERVYDFFEEQLILGNVALGKEGKNFDEERKPIDTIIIHHTSSFPGLTKERLSAIELVRLYAPQYAGKGPTYDANKEIKDNFIYSGHFRNGLQVFWPYHWIVRKDGKCERLLNDDEIGWQAGNWDINCRSTAICLDDDHENGVPSQIELEAIAGLIRKKYSNVSKDRIFGHREINPKTTCPSEFFLSTPEKKGWKDTLLGMI